MSYVKRIMAGASILALASVGVNANAQNFEIQSATGTGSHANFPPSNAIDGVLTNGSRWAGNGSPEEIRLDLGTNRTVDDVRIAWTGNNNATYPFEIAGRSGTSGSWTTIFTGTANGSNNNFINYNVNDINARQVRIRGANDGSFTNITEVQIIGTGGPSTPTPSPSPSPTPSPTPSSSNAVDVPARLEAENFTDFNDADSQNRGGAFRNTPVDIQPCNDSGCGFNVGWTNGGEWLEYEIDVNNSGNYEANLRLAQRGNGAVMSVDVDGQNRTGNISIDSTGNWQSYYTETVSLGNLSSGSHTVRVNFENGGVNFNWVEIEQGGSSSTPTPAPTPTPTPTPSSSNDIGTIRVSGNSNRSNDSNLNGREVDGNIFVFVEPEDSVSQVRFFLNNSQIQTENREPYDFRGGAANSANAFNTDDLSNGNHSIRADVTFSNGSTDSVTANFTVDNGGSSSPSPTPSGSGEFGLDPNAEPWENFDLDDWALDSPEGRSSNECQSRRVNEDDWDEVPGTDTHDYIFTHTDGGMRFVSPVGGSTTSSSCNSGFPRSELREMLRRGNTSISTTGVNPNNWALGYQPNGGNYGGRNGELRATLRVNRVTTTGDGLHPGRTIIGQIHADDDEPLRLYYRKLPGADRGCIYAEHEIRNGDDVTFNMIGNEQCSGNGPSNGIALNELFSYEIRNVNEDIRVRIRRGDQDGPIIDTVTIDMDDLNSGYDRSDEWMYFKAGAYTQNNTGNDNDTDIITFYRLSNTHDDN